MRFVSIVFISSVISACGSSETGDDFIFDISVECTSSQASGCSGSGYTVFVGLAENLSGASCDDFLTGMNAEARQRSFAASGSAISARNGLYLTATINKWRDMSGATLMVLPSDQLYSVCAFVDINGNDRIDTNEPIAQGAVRRGQRGLVISDWHPAYN